ncbi:MAG: tetratricopeptide repeat protein [Bacteroidota bacterium]|nr:tetratricopeptide repeat protein [Bacteroidota bacterium]
MVRRSLWLWLSCLSGLLVSNCQPRLPELKDIEKKQQQVARLQKTEGPTGTNFLEAAFQLARAEENFARKYPNHPQTPALLLEAAQLYANYLADPRKAVFLLEAIDQRFRHQSSLAPQALFFQAFIYENQLNDTARARETYERFLSYYPNHRLAEQARQALRLLGKSPEEVIQEFLQKQPQ